MNSFLYLLAKNIPGSVRGWPLTQADAGHRCVANFVRGAAAIGCANGFAAQVNFMERRP